MTECLLTLTCHREYTPGSWRGGKVVASDQLRVCKLRYIDGVPTWRRGGVGSNLEKPLVDALWAFVLDGVKSYVVPEKYVDRAEECPVFILDDIEGGMTDERREDIRLMRSVGAI